MFVSRFHIVVGTLAFIDWLMWVDVQCGKFQFVYLPSYSFLRTSPVPKIKKISSSWVEHLVRRPNQSPEHLPQDQNLHWATRCKKCQSWLLLYVSVKKKHETDWWERNLQAQKKWSPFGVMKSKCWFQRSCLDRQMFGVRVLTLCICCAALPPPQINKKMKVTPRTIISIDLDSPPAPEKPHH